MGSPKTQPMEAWRFRTWKHLTNFGGVVFPIFFPANLEKKKKLNKKAPLSGSLFQSFSDNMYVFNINQYYLVVL